MITPEARAKLEAEYRLLQEMEIALRTAIRIAAVVNLPSIQENLDKEVAYCLGHQTRIRAELDVPVSP